MPKVIIDLEKVWGWRPELYKKKNTIIRTVTNVLEDKEPTVELSEEFLAEWKLVSQRYYEMQDYLEHCYRKQEGLTPLHNSPFKKDT